MHTLRISTKAKIFNFTIMNYCYAIMYDINNILLSKIQFLIIFILNQIIETKH